MKLFAFLVALAMFVGSFLLFGFAFSFGDSFAALAMFFAGIIAVSLALAIPFHVLERLD